MGAPGRKDDHDFMTEEEVANFLRGPSVGINNYGRCKLGTLVKAAGESVLDVACGTAINYECWKNLGLDLKYTGVDRTDKMLAHARNLYGDEIDLVNGYIQELPFEDNAFDVVVARHIFEHLPPGDMESAFKECVRVAKNKFIAVFFLEPHNQGESRIQENESNGGRDGCTHFWNEYSEAHVMKALSDCGYSFKKIGSIATPGAAHYDTFFEVSKT